MKRAIVFLALFLLMVAYLFITNSTLSYRGVWQILLILVMAILLAIALKRKER